MSVSRRTVLGAGLAAATAGLAGCGPQPSSATWATPGESSSAGPVSSPPGRSAGPSASASPSAPAAVRDDKLAAELERFLKPTKENPKHPTYAGAVALVMVDGKVKAQVAVGHALRYNAGPVELPAARRVAMRADSVFDLASLTKVYTAILVLRQVDKGKLDLAAPVVEYLPDFTGAGKADVTVRMLLTHTSGLPVGATVAGLPDLAAKRKAVLATPLVKGAVPGKVFRYSSTGLMVAAQLVEKVTGVTLDRALKAELTGPMGLRDTGFKPLGWVSSKERLVATDARSSRGLLRGTVHDDVANQMGGVAGSAGIFATARDVAAIGQMLLDGGGGVLKAATVKAMLTNANRGLPAVDPERPGRPSDHGLGVVLRQPWFMGKLSTAATFGHTGFTGTSLLVEPKRKLVLALLTNRAHPNWSWANPDPMRVAIANVVAELVG
ncbi:serine hydrolase domain-containing protein [Phytohabitans houttuyneae]|uniref:serine hydrolase domain-containing protein n=1 Tax=Phytohabitans houttuyneae TaxID=1076126 RepID=UPI00156652F3|nr:serine hydrolase domain-containing protein [Phytohabitans houttuyneae]